MRAFISTMLGGAASCAFGMAWGYNAAQKPCAKEVCTIDVTPAPAAPPINTGLNFYQHADCPPVNWRWTKGVILRDSGLDGGAYSLGPP